MNYFTDEKSKLLSDMGMKCCMDGDLEKGLKYFNTGLELDENNILLLYNKAGCLINMGETEKAEIVFKKVIKLCDEMGKDEFTLNTKANSYLFLRDFENAKYVLDDLLEITPDNVNALISVAQILNEKFRYDDALIYLEKALCIDPQNCDALMFKGETLFDLFRYEEAKECIDRSFEISSKSPYIWYLKGKCETYFQNYEDAIEYHKKAIGMIPNFEKGYYELAKCYVLLGRAEEAKITFRKIFDMNPDRYDEGNVELADQIVDLMTITLSQKDS